MGNSMTDELRGATTWSIVLSVLIMIAGFLAIALPLVAGITVTLIVGWMLIFAGVMHIVYAFRAGRPRAAVWQVLFGLVYGFIGIYILLNPVMGLAGVTFAIAAYLLADAVIELVLANQLRSEPGRGWLVFDAVIMFALALLIFFTWPASAAWAVGTLVGISMLFSGLTRLMMTLAARRPVATA